MRIAIIRMSDQFVVRGNAVRRHGLLWCLSTPTRHAHTHISPRVGDKNHSLLSNGDDGLMFEPKFEQCADGASVHYVKTTFCWKCAAQNPICKEHTHTHTDTHVRYILQASKGRPAHVRFLPSSHEIHNIYTRAPGRKADARTGNMMKMNGGQYLVSL